MNALFLDCYFLFLLFVVRLTLLLLFLIFICGEIVPMSMFCCFGLMDPMWSHKALLLESLLTNCIVSKLLPYGVGRVISFWKSVIAYFFIPKLLPYSTAEILSLLKLVLPKPPPWLFCWVESVSIRSAEWFSYMLIFLFLFSLFYIFCGSTYSSKSWKFNER